ncbi:SusE domain-containing protein [Nonlabens ponticola]|uniref:SusE outer membrane protein domain-containing protein n=1 Tax=Nonlabens ponticola TaxID=2496866 RepID=A0A3S9MWK8_9FLAO|nr:SusE domain-containing protein [Nonlabens ponticola]AZQ43524.1 hypothetical protein EJ995_04475 [Nonlabens ponticola]
MKKFSILLWSFLAITAAISCSDDDEQLFIDQPDSQLSFRSQAASSYILTFDTRANLAERLVWNTPSFDTPISVNYEVQASADPNNFDDAVTVTTTNGDSADLSVERLNELSAELGLTPFSEGVIAMRIVGTTADNDMDPLVSDVLILPVTPYTTDSPRLYVPGNYAEASGYGSNWNPGDDETPFLEAVEFGSTEYEGFIFMANESPEFKFTPGRTFDDAFGEGDDDDSLSTDGGNLSVDGPGYYYITVNTDPNGDGDFSDATWSAADRQWGIIGQATTPTNSAGWGDELDMTYDPDSKQWSVNLDMEAGEFKFRAQTWDFPTANFGQGDDGDNDLEFNAGNLAVENPGSYRAVLDLSTPRNYSYELIAQ